MHFERLCDQKSDSFQNAESQIKLKERRDKWILFIHISYFRFKIILDLKE